MIMRDLIITALLFSMAIQVSASDLVFKVRVATALHKLNVYTDSSFTKQSREVIAEGQLLEVLSETVREHEDEAQNQTFKWYQVKRPNGKTAWVYGGGLAVIVPEAQVDPIVKAFHKSRYGFNNGFENAVIWAAAIEGRDNFHEQDFLNPLYKEHYLVITNDRGRSVHIHYAGLSTQGENKAAAIQLKDITGDEVAEIILNRISKSTGSERENRNLEIFSFQAGTLNRVLEEYLSLSYSDEIPSPALYKKVEIDKGSVRISYVDYLTCNKYQLPFEYDPRGKSKERCLEYITYTYLWSERDNKYQLFYEPSHTYLRAGVKGPGTWLRKEPKRHGQQIASIKKTDLLKVIKHFERYVMEGGIKKVQSFLYVQIPSGQYGYLPAAEVGFTGFEHAELLNAYYNNPPLSKTDWKSDESFLRVSIPRQDAVSSGK